MGANLLAVAAIWGWLPIVLMIFAVRPPRQAVVFSFMFSWLFLPGIGFNLPGLPDWTKMTATVVAVTLGALVFDGPRVFALRPRWFDLPVAVWCLAPFASAISNGNGAYDGLSAILDHAIAWGLPYLLGRLYFADAEGARVLALGIVIGSLAYIPLCLIEIRMSPILRGLVYGMPRWEGTRYGGFRPAVFLATGLELGMWMTMACIMAERLWASGSVRRLGGWPFGALTLALLATTVLGRSTGALGMLLIAWVVLYASKLVGRSWPVWLALAIPPTFCAVRSTGVWSGESAVQFAKAAFGEDRAESLEFRFSCENNHIGQALKQPILGYSRTSGFMKGSKASGKWTEKIVDSYWMIALGTMGFVGLATMNCMLLLPMILTARRFPARTWADPDVAPTVALALFLVVFMIDNLSNAMPNPIYAVAMGAVTGMRASGPRGRGRAGAALAGALAVDDRADPEGAAAAFALAADLAGPAGEHGGPGSREIRAEALTGLGRALARSGRLVDAEHAARDAVDIRLDLATGSGDAGRLADLASAHEELARLLSGSGDAAGAIAERRKALELWGSLLAAMPREVAWRDHKVDSLNDLAWLLCTAAEATLRDPEAAVSLASEAARLSPEDPACWNTLGVARYRSGDWAGAFDALEYSVARGPEGGTAFDHFFLSMACLRLGEVDHARAWFDVGVDWADRDRPGHPGLASFRSEAAALLVGAAGKSPGQISS